MMTGIAIEPNPTISQSDDLLIASIAPNYQWVKDAQDLAGETNQTLNITPPNTDYQVYTVSEHGCLSYSSPFATNLGIEEAQKEGAILVPNPATSQVVIITTTPIDAIVCYDQNGKTVNLPQIGKDTYDVRHLSSGYYQIKVMSKESTVHIKMLRIE